MSSAFTPLLLSLVAGVLRGLEALLQQLLAAPLPHQPEQLLLHARAVEAFGRVLAVEPSAVPAVIQRVSICVAYRHQGGDYLDAAAKTGFRPRSVPSAAVYTALPWLSDVWGWQYSNVLLRQVFDLQTKALPLERPGQEAPPAHPPPGWKAGVNARQKVSGGQSLSLQ